MSNSPSTPTLSWSSIFDNIECPDSDDDTSDNLDNSELASLWSDNHSKSLTDYFINSSPLLPHHHHDDDLFPFQPSPPLRPTLQLDQTHPSDSFNLNNQPKIQLDTLKQLAELQQSYLKHIENQKTSFINPAPPPPLPPPTHNILSHPQSFSLPLPPPPSSLNNFSTQQQPVSKSKKRTRSTSPHNLSSISITTSSKSKSSRNNDPTQEEEAQEEEEEERRKKDSLERNRIAASKSRQKKRMRVDDLETRATALTHSNHQLQTTALALLAEAKSLRAELSHLHTTCHCTHVVGYTLRETNGGGLPLIERLARTVLDDDRHGEWDTNDGRVPAPSLGSEDDVVAVAWARKLEKKKKEEEEEESNSSKKKKRTTTTSSLNIDAPVAAGTRLHGGLGGAAAALRKKGPTLKSEGLGLDLGVPVPEAGEQGNREGDHNMANVLLDDDDDDDKEEMDAKPDTKCRDQIPLRRRRSSRVAAKK
ncbi:hypothetical protein T439DRAFT_378055 [Meredithblackwellia eburnea MCA 4105]